MLELPESYTIAGQLDNEIVKENRLSRWLQEHHHINCFSMASRKPAEILLG